MRHRYLEYIIPLLASLILSAVLIRSLPVLTVNYKTGIVYFEQKALDNYDYYVDLNGDGTSERIFIYYNAAGNIAISISSLETRSINQFNLPGDLIRLGDLFDLEDINKDGTLDFLMCTIKEDSLFLSVIDDIYSRPTTHRSFFVEKVNQYNDQGDYLFKEGKIGDMNDDGIPEYYFGINGGHSLQPRAVFAVDLENGLVTKSPLSGTAIVGLDFFDLDGDGKDEILLNTASPENFKIDFPYRDSTSWFMVLDHDLEFYREPVEIPGAPAWFSQEPFVYNGQKYILLFSLFRGEGKPHSELSVYDNAMNLVKKETAENLRIFPHYSDRITGTDSLNDIRLFAGTRIFSIDFDLNITDSVYNKEGFNYGNAAKLDMDNDGIPEIISFYQSKIGISRLDFSDLSVIDLDIHGINTRPIMLYSLLTEKNKNSKLVFQVDTNIFFITYSKNPWYHFRYLSHILLFFSIFGISLSIMILQRKFIERRLEKDQLINRLQLQTLKSQLDPHFTYNTLNAIGSLIYKEEKDLAYQYLQILTDLLRFISNEAIEIKWTLMDELNFVSRYLELQKLRFRDKFNFIIHVDEQVSNARDIPKMAILSFVENAIKHGLNNIDRKSIIEIRAFKVNGALNIEIEDNGIGRQAASKDKDQSGGKGNKMMREYFNLFTQVTGKKAKFEIIDLQDNQNQPHGTRVIITIR